MCVCACMYMYVFAITAIPLNLELSNFGITFLMSISKNGFTSNYLLSFYKSNLSTKTSLYILYWHRPRFYILEFSKRLTNTKCVVQIKIIYKQVLVGTLHTLSMFCWYRSSYILIRTIPILLVIKYRNWYILHIR